MLRFILIVVTCALTRADYDCLCSYNIETPVFSTDVNSSQKFGYMYEFDCKPILTEAGLNTTTWQAVAFEHRKGYIQLDPQIQIQICPGDPSQTDILTTLSPTHSSSLTTLSSTSSSTKQSTTPQTKTRKITGQPTTTLNQATQPTTTLKQKTQPTTTLKQTTQPTSTLNQTTQPPTTLKQTTQPTTTLKQTTQPTTTLQQTIQQTTTLHQTTKSTTSLNKTTQPTSTLKQPTQPTTRQTTTQTTTRQTATQPTTWQTTTRKSTTTQPTTRQTPTQPTTRQTTTRKSTTRQTTTQPTTTQQTTTQPTTRQTTTQPTTRQITTRKSTTRQTTTQPTTQQTATQPTTRQTTLWTTSRQTTTRKSTTGQTTTQPTTQQTTTQPTTRQTTQWTTNRQTTTRKLTTGKTTTQPISTRQTTTQSTTWQTTTQRTTSRQTTTQQTTSQPTTTQAAILLGNVSLCPSSVVQYAKQDKEILTQMDNSCYTVVRHRYSWSHAESVCNNRGGHLFHVQDSNENLAIYILLNTHFNHAVWMGLSDLNQEEHFQWTSNISLNYTNWMPGRKTSGHNKEDCVVFVPYMNHGQWNDVHCGGQTPNSQNGLQKNYFICQFHTLNSPTPSPSVISQIHPGSIFDCPRNVPRGYLARYGTSCYERVPLRGTWNFANDDCSRKGGHLVQIGSAQEEAAIIHLLSHTDSQHAVWIGLHDQGHEETFTWTSGESLIYTNWLPGRKSNVYHHSAENCVVLVPYKQGMWDDIPCTEDYVRNNFGYLHHWEIHPYICEYHTVSVGGHGGGPNLIGR